MWPLFAQVASQLERLAIELETAAHPALDELTAKVTSLLCFYFSLQSDQVSFMSLNEMRTQQMQVFWLVTEQG